MNVFPQRGPSCKYLGICGSTEGDCYKVYCTKCDADLHAPQGVDLGEGGSLSYGFDTLSDWPWLHVHCKAVSKIPGIHGSLYKTLTFTFIYLFCQESGQI